MKKAYVENLHLNKSNKERLEVINRIIESYRRQGYKLTLRQLYYQLVSKDIIANKLAEYSKLSLLLTKGRMAGVVDWNAIEDRLRVPSKPSAWENPKEIVDAVVEQYRRDRMENQNVHIEVWVEKDALSGVLKRATEPYGVYLMVNRGYSSTSAMHDAYLRFRSAWDDNKRVVILYLGDHDPSGLDMVRDIRARIATFNGDQLEDDVFEVKRIALTMEQIRQYRAPPNPAKFSDPRATDYVKEHGRTSWEVDALPPDALNKLVEDNIKELIDEDEFAASKEQEENDRQRLRDMADKLGDDDE